MHCISVHDRRRCLAALRNMASPSLQPDSEPDLSSRGSDYDEEADDEGYPESSGSTSNWSELESPDRASFEVDEDGEGEYNEEEFAGILSLANQARELYDASHTLHDLEDTIAYLRDALSVAPPERTRRAEVMHSLAYDLYIFAQASMDQETASHIAEESLDDSIRLHRNALKMLPSHHPSRAIYLTRLAIALRARFLRRSTARDLHECVTLHSRALCLRPVGHPDRGQSLLNLANAHWTRYEHKHAMEDLEEAIKYDRAVLELRPPGHPHRVTTLSSLATDLAARYRRLEQSSDLDKVIALQTEALLMLPDGDGRVNTAHQLSVHLMTRFHTKHSREDLSTAIDVIEEARCRGDSECRFLSLQILAELYLLESIESDDPSRLEHAIELHRSCLASHPSRPDLMGRLSHALTLHSEHIQSLSVINEAIVLSEKAFSLCPPRHPLRSSIMCIAARAYYRRFRQSRQAGDLDQTYEHFARAVRDPHCNIRHRVKSAGEWIRFVFAADRADWKLEAIQWKLKLLFALFLAYPKKAFDAEQIKDARCLGEEGAACALKLSRLEDAVMVLEMGLELSASWSSNPGCGGFPPRDLSSRLADMIVRLDTSEHILSSTHSCLPITDYSDNHLLIDNSSRTVELGEEISRLTEEVWQARRNVAHEVARFHDGYVVYLLANSPHCEALAVQPVASASICSIALPLSRDALERLVAAFNVASPQAEDQYLRLLLRLWENIAKPIVNGLHLQRSDGSRPRLWWCPTGPFRGLPLHAAGCIRGAATSAACLSDYVVSSYTSSIYALCRARERKQQASRKIIVLSTQPDETQPRQPYKGESCEVLSTPIIQAAEGLRATMLGSRASMMQCAPEVSVIHIVCPSTVNIDSPHKSGFDLPDGRLTVSDFASLGQRAPLFAFVTKYDATPFLPGVGALNFYTEFALAGFKSIVGSLWTIPDSEQKKIAEKFYTRIFKTQPVNYSVAAYITDNVMHELRESGAPCSLWVSYVHMGY